MILGMSLSTFTLLHVVISLVGIASGLIVVYGFIAGKRLDIWTALFLLTTVLTSATGFLFPFKASSTVSYRRRSFAAGARGRHRRALSSPSGRWLAPDLRGLCHGCSLSELLCIGSAVLPQGFCVACIGSQRQRAAVPHRSACTPGNFCRADDCCGQEIRMLTRGSFFQSISSDGQSRLMKPPSGQKAKMLASELYLATDP